MERSAHEYADRWLPDLTSHRGIDWLAVMAIRMQKALIRMDPRTLRMSVPVHAECSINGSPRHVSEFSPVAPATRSPYLERCRCAISGERAAPRRLVQRRRDCGVLATLSKSPPPASASS